MERHKEHIIVERNNVGLTEEQAAVDVAELKRWQWRLWSASVICFWGMMNIWVIWTKALIGDLALPGFTGPNIKPGINPPALYQSVYHPLEWFIITYPVLITAIIAIYMSLHLCLAFVLKKRFRKTLYLQITSLVLGMISVAIHTWVLNKVNPDLAQWFSIQLVNLN